MRYIIHKSQSQEISGRIIYLYDTFHLYFITQNIDDEFITLIPIGEKGPDILFIVGHINIVEDYISRNIKLIMESTIVVTTCTADRLKKFTKYKTIFTPNINGYLCYIRDGKPYGFKFGITDAELDMYNSPGDIWARINAGYQQL